MGFFRNLATPAPVPVSTHALADLIVADALQNGSYAADQYLAIAAVFRARMMNADIPASLPITANGVPLNDTADKVVATCLSLQDAGDAYWLLDGDSFTVANPQDIVVRWNTDRTRRLYFYRSERQLRTEGLSRNLIVLSVNRGPGDLTGCGWMESGRLDGLLDEQNYAAEYWANSGQPTGSLMVPSPLTADEAATLKEQWEAARVVRSPAVLSGGMSWSGTSFNMADSEWTAGHLVGIGDVASLSGVPSSFLSYSPAGSSLVYNSGADLWRQYYSQTLQPTYIVRMERAWSDVLNAEVKFDPEQLLIASLQERSQAASVLVAAGYDPADVADVVGLPPMEAVEAPTVEVPVDVA